MAAGAAAAVAAVALSVPMLVGQDDERVSEPMPAPTPTATELPEPAFESPYLTDDQVAPELDPTTYGELPVRPFASWLTVAQTPDVTSWDPVDPVPLEQDPVDTAVVAVQSAWGEPPAISVLDIDGRWRSIDMTGIERRDPSTEGRLGISPGSFSPDREVLAIAQTASVILVDVTTGERQEYDVPGLGPDWQSREVRWGDARTVYVSTSLGRRAVAVDVRTGAVTRPLFDPIRSVTFADGSVLEDQLDPSTHLRTLLRLDDQGNPVDSYQTSGTVIGALDQWTACLDKWAARRIEAGWTSEDPRADGAPASGVQVHDADGRPVRLLPVKGWDANGDGGQVLGWLDKITVAFAVYESDQPGGMHVLAWNIMTDEVSWIADHTWAGAMALASQR